MKKHAYVIMAHHQLDLLEQLLQLLDDERNDIFLHIDKKVKDFPRERFVSVCKKARVIYPARRLDVRWGTNSQVKCEMLLYKTALRYGPYHYYHLISGADLPLHSQNYIHQRLEHETTSFLSYTENPSVWDVRRLSRYHNVVPKWVPGYKRWNAMLAAEQERRQVDRLKHLPFAVQKGASWASLTQEAIEKLVENQAMVRKLTRFSLCADEGYKQTLLLAWECPVTCNDLRLVIWEEENHPEILTMKHWPLLRDSDRLFARKFDPATDEEVIRNIIRKVRDEENGEHRTAGV